MTDPLQDSFLLSSHCFSAVPSDCAGTGTLRKSRDGKRQEKGWRSVDPFSQIPVCSVPCCTQGKVPSL